MGGAIFSAQAQTGLTGAYVGAGLGTAHARDLNHGSLITALGSQGVDLRSVKAEDSDTGWKLYGGWRFDANWAVEAGYTDLGSYGFDGQVVSDPGTAKATFKAGSWNVQAVGLLPLNPAVDLFLKAGVGFWQASLDDVGSFAGRSVRSTDANGLGPVFGFGGQWRMAPQWGLRLEGERYFNVGKTSETGRTDIDLLSISLSYHF